MALACAIEMIHAYSLIHDDLPCMDDDDFRRGKPSCHKAFGEANALLAGDGLLTLAFETAADAPLSDTQRVEAVRTLAKAAGVRGMLGGQVIDLGCEGKPVDLETLNTLYALKTGALLRASRAARLSRGERGGGTPGDGGPVRAGVRAGVPDHRRHPRRGGRRRKAR